MTEATVDRLFVWIAVGSLLVMLLVRFGWTIGWYLR